MENEIIKKIKLNIMDENGKYNFLGYKISYLNIKEVIEKAWHGIIGYRCNSDFDSSVFRWDIFEKYYQLSIDNNVGFGSKVHNRQFIYLEVPNDNRLSCMTTLYEHYINTFHWSCGVSISGKPWFNGSKIEPNEDGNEFVLVKNEHYNNGTTIIASNDWVTHWYLVQHMYLAYRNMIKEDSGDYDKQFLKEQLEKLLTCAGFIRNPNFSKGIRIVDCGSTCEAKLCIGYYTVGYVEMPNYTDEDLSTLLKIGVASKGIEYDFKAVKEQLKNFIKERIN